MTSRIFLDTSGWLAAVNTRDSRHKDVVKAYDELLAARAAFVTSSLVISEMHALVVRERGAKAGCDLLDAVYSDPHYHIVAVDRDLEIAATDRWLRRFEQKFSLADAVSFEIMRTERIRQALALDHHFEVAGYDLVPAPKRSATPAAKKKQKTP